ncbi:hypothetical protein B0H11DRAFT_1957067 [Mycena galericulata]|nr:hypothetical protein B0H11DRAFT_1957067 [Mycena galericulata]
MNEVIEIPSSPEQSPRLRPLRVNETIVLTDSEDEEYLKPRHFRERGGHAGEAGPSKKKNPAPLLQHKKDASSGSLENIPAKRRPKSKSVPLFLPSDEENEPPVFADDEIDLVDIENLPPPPDPIPGFVTQVLEIIPDVDPEYALSLVRQHYPQSQDQVLEPVLHALFEDPAYPKLDRKGKRKRVEDEDPADGRGKHKAAKLDYGSKDREYKGGVHYAQLSIDQLMLDFPYIPKPHIRRTLLDQHSFYAPTYLFLAEEKRSGILPYIPKTVPSRAPAKGKRKALHDSEFEKEREWISSRAPEDGTSVTAHDEEEYVDSGDGIECGCCFSNYPFEKMIQCPDAHLFCSSCMTTYAETLLGSHDHKIICMDQSGCKLPFPDTELHRFLTPKLMSLYERVKQTKEVEAAGIEGLEECPFCEYKCVIENEQEKLFTCRNDDCAAISCRQCKQLDHLPKSCKEMEEDKNLDGRHTIEEAMTRALMRNCPKCQKPFIKDQGCNKMSCPNCFTLSCYICRKIISGYDHFSQQPGQPLIASSSKAGAKCALWDPVEQRHAEEVKEAAERALRDYKRDHPDIDEEHLKVDLPVAPPAPPAPGLHAMPYVNMQAALANVHGVQAAIANAHANAHGWVMAQMAQLQYLPPAPPPMPAVRAPARAPKRKAAKKPRWK